MKEKMTEHSIRLFEKKGFSETSISDIVESVGVTKGTFYYYFTSKEQLLMDIHLAYIDELLSEQERIMLEPGKSCKDKLFDMVLMLLKSIKTKKSSATVFFREMKNLSDEKLAQILPKRDEFRNKIEQVLIRASRAENYVPISMHPSSLLLFWVWPIGAIIGSTQKVKKPNRKWQPFLWG